MTDEPVRDEVRDAQIRQALAALQVHTWALRKRGYDATLHAEDRGDQVTCEIRVRVPALGIPVESQCSCTSGRPDGKIRRGSRWALTLARRWQALVMEVKAGAA